MSWRKGSAERSRRRAAGAGGAGPAVESASARGWILRFTLYALLLTVCCASALAEQRFPPPEFESGHQLPVMPTPAARALLWQYLDVAVLGVLLGLATWVVYRKRSRRGVLALSVFSLLYFGFWRKGCVCAIGSLQNVALALGDGRYAVPLVVTVNDWRLPDPKDFRQHHLIYLSTDSVAKHYGVPLWSDKHFELMAKSLSLMAEVNAREIPATLAINFHSDNKGDISNEESLVRWIKQPDGAYKYDFTVFDKYLDLVAKHLGKPMPLRVSCWGEAGKKDGQVVQKAAWPTSVSRLDPVTGKTEPMAMPVPGTEESFAFWKPVLDEVRKKVEARGWWDVTALGHNSYCWGPLPEVVSVAKKIWPDGVWSYIAHNGTLGASFPAAEKGVGMPVKFSVCVWTEGGLRPRGCRDLFKPRSSLWCDTARNRHWDWSPLIQLRNLPEEIINRGMDGLGDFGADLFPVRKDSGKGFYMLGNGRGTGGPGAATHSLLAPGPDGAIATERFECFREGMELGEALLYLEQALLDKKAGGELAQKVNRYLDERGEVFTRYWYERGGQFISRWSPAAQVERDAQLLELCAEVAKASGQ